MRQILARDSKSRILACAPSNSAADLLADRLRQQGLGPSEMFRLNAATRLVSTLPATLKAYARISGDGFVIPPAEDLSKFRVVVATCISASLPYCLGIGQGHFNHIFIDEAGQALEPEAMIAIRTMAGVHTNVVLSGDPRQLGPIVRSRVAAGLGLSTSYLDRLMSRDVYNLDTGKGITLGTWVEIVSARPY
jgi:helicase MOV-10